jgi:hypothetical protein
MPEHKKTLERFKRTREETKKESNGNSSEKKENLEKIVEKKENKDSKKMIKEKIIPESFSFENVKLNKKINISLDKINSSQQQKVHFLERNLEKETSLKNEKQEDSNYISKSQDKESPKYQHYENATNVKLNRPNEIDTRERTVGFISSENANLPATHYENYVSPERFNPEKFNEEKKSRKVVGKVEMKYSSKH